MRSRERVVDVFSPTGNLGFLPVVLESASAQDSSLRLFCRLRLRVAKGPRKTEWDGAPFGTGLRQIFILILEEKIQPLWRKNEVALHANGVNRIVRKRRRQTLIRRNLPLVEADNAVTPNGKWVYTSNAGTSTISGFTIGSHGALTALPGTIVGTNPSGATNLDIAITSDGKFLYSLDGEIGKISIFGIQSDGALTNLGTTGTLPEGVGFNGIAAN